jgi:hypothetical protein
MLLSSATLLLASDFTVTNDETVLNEIKQAAQAAAKHYLPKVESQKKPLDLRLKTFWIPPLWERQ